MAEDCALFMPGQEPHSESEGFAKGLAQRKFLTSGLRSQLAGYKSGVDAPLVSPSSGRAQSDGSFGSLSRYRNREGALYPGFDRVAWNQAGVWPFRHKTAPHTGSCDVFYPPIRWNGASSPFLKAGVSAPNI